MHGRHRACCSDPMSGTYSRSTIGAPRIGFSLDRASIEDGILTCHWHQARFELTSGSTFDLWADDVFQGHVP